MSRPRRGTDSGRIATNRWRETMLKKYGSEEAVHEHMVEMGSKGGKRGHRGGFASKKAGKDGLTGPERAHKYGKIGGAISKRGPAKKKL